MGLDDDLGRAEDKQADQQDDECCSYRHRARIGSRKHGMVKGEIRQQSSSKGGLIRQSAVLLFRGCGGLGRGVIPSSDAKALDHGSGKGERCERPSAAAAANLRCRCVCVSASTRVSSTIVARFVAVSTV